MNNLRPIGASAQALGVSTSTPRRWEVSCRLTHKDRLLRFGADLSNQGANTTSEKDLASDVLEMMTVFSARLYGSRSHRNQKLLDGVRQAVKEAQC